MVSLSLYVHIHSWYVYCFICLSFVHSAIYSFFIFNLVLRVFSNLLEQSIIMRIAILAVLALLVPMTMAGKTQIQSYKIEHSYRDYNVYNITTLDMFYLSYFTDRLPARRCRRAKCNRRFFKRNCADTCAR